MAGPRAPKPKGKAKAKGKGKAKATAKAKGPPVRKRHVRKSAFRYVRALDHVLQLSLGHGLVTYIPGPTPAPLKDRPLLTLVQDEGPQGLAAACFLQNHLKASVVTLHDVFHREWNDTKGALKAAGLWWVVLLTTCTFNVAFGPWDGAGFFGKIKGAAQELFAKTRVQDPLFQTFYNALCRDEGEPAVGSVEHQQQILDKGTQHEAYALKGPRVALCRWFHWVKAARFHDGVWNWRLMAIVAMCMELGYNRTVRELDLFGGGRKGWRRQARRAQRQPQRRSWLRESPQQHTRPGAAAAVLALQPARQRLAKS